MIASHLHYSDEQTAPTARDQSSAGSYILDRNCCELPSRERSTTTRFAFQSSCKHVASSSLYPLICRLCPLCFHRYHGRYTPHAPGLIHPPRTTILHHHNSTFGYLLYHNHCTTAYQQHLRKCIIATPFPLSSWARTRSAARTRRGKIRPLQATLMAQAPPRHGHLLMGPS